MTLLPPGVKVHLAFGHTDMRKGIDGLPCWSRACCGRIPSRATSLCSAVGRRTSSRSCSGMGPASASSPSGRARRLPLAVERRARWDASAELGAALDADRGRRLARSRKPMATCRCRLTRTQLATD